MGKKSSTSKRYTADHHRAGPVADTLRMAAGRGVLREGRITHSDRGAEYTSREYRAVTKESGLRRSMGRTGSCCDNAAAESFSGLLEAETGTTVRESYDQARADAFHFIEVGYNRTRLRKHPVCGYVTPVETRALTAQALTPGSVTTRCPCSGGNFTMTTSLPWEQVPWRAGTFETCRPVRSCRG
ncbi:DDE-type integrase/transposase/recombinase [Streptomyces sp. MA15]|uniref:DDE-type integrase/transposase/recombinase n=1 Tax=Streptomyces sp. MA15 TaxID=3055061 RepID=UPI00339DA56E